MLSKSKSSRNAAQTTDTLIGHGTEIEGTLTCEASLRIEGKFNGVIESQGSVIVGEHAIARSDIHARDIVIAGKVYGDVMVEGKLTITSTGQMFGDVLEAASLVIAEGGILNGASKMEPKKAEAAPETETPFLQSEAG